MIPYHYNHFIIKMTSALTKRTTSLPTLTEEELTTQNETFEGSQIPNSDAQQPEVYEIQSDLKNGPAILERYQSLHKQIKPKPDILKGLKDLAEKKLGLRPSTL